MLSSISPLGERARNSRWWLTTAAYLLGSLAGGLAVGALAALLGSAPARRGAHLALDAGRRRGAAGRRAGARPARRSGRCPRGAARSTWHWLTRYRGWVYGVGFGAQLGFGLVTIITSATTYAAVLLAALTGHLGAGLAIGATFGVVRALPSLLMARVVDRDDLHRVFTRVERWANPARSHR